MTDHIERFILLLMLTIFAIYGITYGVPKVGEVLRDKMERAASVK